MYNYMFKSFSYLVIVLILSISSICYADINADITQMLLQDSDGSTTITNLEAEKFIEDVSKYNADDAILGIVIINKLRSGASDDVYSKIVEALRYQVKGLGVSLRQAPGSSYYYDDDTNKLTFYFDPQGVKYSSVNIVYTIDNWSSTSWSELSYHWSGVWTLEIDIPDKDSHFEYAMYLIGLDGWGFWINNGRETGVYNGRYWLNYSFDISAANENAKHPAEPAFVQLVQTFTDSSSHSGSVISQDEFSLLVEQLTWEGGMGVNDSKIIRPVIFKINNMEANGENFEGNTKDGMIDFLMSMVNQFKWASYPGLKFEVTDDGQLNMIILQQNLSWARLYYTTDGWNTPRVSECAPQYQSFAKSSLPVCKIGYVPPEVLMSYVMVFYDNNGNERWVKVDGNYNFFQEVPNLFASVDNGLWKVTHNEMLDTDCTGFDPFEDLTDYLYFKVPYNKSSLNVHDCAVPDSDFCSTEDFDTYENINNRFIRNGINDFDNQFDCALYWRIVITPTYNNGNLHLLHEAYSTAKGSQCDDVIAGSFPAGKNSCAAKWLRIATSLGSTTTD